MAQLDDNKMTISLSVKTKLIDEMLAKKFFHKVPMSDDDYLYSLFAFGMWKSKTDIDEFNLFNQMLLDMGKVQKIDIENI